MPRLIVIHGPDEGRQFPIAPGTAVTVGRHSTNPVPLRDPQVSRRHFDLRPGPDGVQLVDLDSGNGTRVNGQTVRSASLRVGDRIAVGETVLLYAADPAPAETDPVSARAAAVFAGPEQTELPVVKAVPTAEPVVRP